MMFKIVNKECPGYFTSYRTYIKIAIATTLDYLLTLNALAVPKCRSNAGLRTFHARATHLWNRLDDNLRNMTNESNFKKTLAREILKH